MSRPHFDADVIASLRNRVVAHNEAGQGRRVNLGELKKIYAGGWRGQDPAGRAMQKVEGHLSKLAKAFEEGKVRRDGDGRFAPKGGQSSLYRDVAEPEQDRALRDQNSGYAAAQTAVIPETRYSTFGPAVFGALGVARGAIRGAFPDTSKSDPVWVGSKFITGQSAKAAGMAVGSAVESVKRQTANVIAAARGQARTTVAEDLQAARRAAAAGGEVGSKIARGAWRAVDYAIDEAPVFGLRRHHRNARAAIAAEGLKGGRRLAANIARLSGGAAKGAIIPGAVMGYGGYKVMSAAGPYLDAAFPRRVEKMAKVASIPADRQAEVALRKVGFRPLVARGLHKVAAEPKGAEALEKAFIRPAMQRAQSIGMSVVRAIRAPMMPKAPSAPSNPIKAQGAAQARRMVREGDFSRPGKIAITGIGIGAGAAAGAGLAAGGGWAAGQVRRTYHDEKGRFTSKDKAVTPGMAAVGGAAGAVAGALGAAALLAGNRRAVLQTAIRATRAATSADVRAAADKAFDRTMKASQPKIDAAKVKIVTRLDAASRAATDPVEWNRWRVDSETAERIAQRLRSDDFWEGERRLRPAANRAFRASPTVEGLEQVGLSQRQMDELKGIARAASTQKAAYEAKVTAFRTQADDAAAARDTAQKAVESARAAKAAAEDQLKTLTDATEITTTKARILDLSNDVDANTKAYQAALKRAEAYADVASDPTKVKAGVAFPQAPDPWEPKRYVAPRPSEQELEALATNMEAKALDEIRAGATRKAEAAAEEARSIALATVQSLNQMRNPGVAGQKVAGVAAVMGRHMAAAKADVVKAGGSVRAALSRKGADPAQPGEMASIFTRAKNRLKTVAVNTAKEAVDRPLATAGKLAAVSAPAAVVFGVADYTQDGQLNFSLQNTNLKHLLDPKTAPRPVVRVFHPGTKDQVVLSGIVGSNKKGERIFISGEYRDANGAVTNIEPLAQLKDINDLLNNRRGGGGGGFGGGGQGAPASALANATPADRKVWDDAISKARQAGDMEMFGDGDLAIEGRRGSVQVPEAQSAAGKMVSELSKLAAEEQKKGGDSGKGYRAGAFYSLLASALSDPSSSVMTFGERSSFMRMNVFSPSLASALGNASNSADTLRIMSQHIQTGKNVPYWSSPEQEKLLRQAFRVMNRQLPAERQMNPDHLADLDAVINRHKRGMNSGVGGQPGGGGGQPSSGGGAATPAAAPVSAAAPLTRMDFIGDAIDRIGKQYAAANKPAPKQLERMVEGAFSAVEGTFESDPNMRALSEEERFQRIRDDVVKRQVAPLRNLRRSADASTLRKARQPEERGYFEPVRFGGTLGGAIGSQAAWAAASHFMPARVRAAGKVGRFAFKLGGGLIGGIAGGAAGEAAGRMPYEARGLRAPPPWEPPNRTPREEISRTAGSIAGGIGGAMLAGKAKPFRAVGLGIAGQLGGEEVAARADRLVARAERRFRNFTGRA
jgi:hypothetical protein